MKNVLNINRIAAFTGIVLGAFALSALAAGSWTPPTGTPPANNVDAPINVGSVGQYKSGPLGIGAETGLTSGTLFKVFGLGAIEHLVSGDITNAGTTTTENLVVRGLTGEGYFTYAPESGSTLISADNKGTVRWKSPTSSTANKVKCYGMSGTFVAPLENNSQCTGEAANTCNLADSVDSVGSDCSVAATSILNAEISGYTTCRWRCH